MARIYKYPEELKQEALQAVDSGMTQMDVAKSLGISRGVIEHWVSERRRNEVYVAATAPKQVTKPDTSAARPIEPSKSALFAPPRMGLQEFVNLLKQLALDYENTQTRLHSLEKQVEHWKQLAGKLNAEMQDNMEKR